MEKGKIIFVIWIKENQLEVIEKAKKNAKNSKLFDDVKLYSSSNVHNPHIQHDGYDICQYPWIILDVMKIMDDNDVLVFSSSLDELPSKKDLKKWCRILSDNSAIFFFSESVIEAMTDRLLQDSYYRNKVFPYLKFCGNLFLLKKSARTLIEEWQDQMTSSTHPIYDPELSMLRNVVYNRLDDNKIIILRQENSTTSEKIL